MTKNNVILAVWVKVSHYPTSVRWTKRLFIRNRRPYVIAEFRVLSGGESRKIFN